MKKSLAVVVSFMCGMLASTSAHAVVYKYNTKSAVDLNIDVLEGGNADEQSDAPAPAPVSPEERIILKPPVSMQPVAAAPTLSAPQPVPTAPTVAEVPAPVVSPDVMSEAKPKKKLASPFFTAPRGYATERAPEPEETVTPAAPVPVYRPPAQPMMIVAPVRKAEPAKEIPVIAKEPPHPPAPAYHPPVTAATEDDIEVAEEPPQPPVVKKPEIMWSQQTPPQRAPEPQPQPKAQTAIVPKEPEHEQIEEITAEPMRELAPVVQKQKTEMQAVTPAREPQVTILSREKPSVPLNAAPEVIARDDQYDHAKAPGAVPVPKDIVLGHDKNGRFYDECTGKKPVAAANPLAEEIAKEEAVSVPATPVAPEPESAPVAAKQDEIEWKEDAKAPVTPASVAVKQDQITWQEEVKQPAAPVAKPEPVKPAPASVVDLSAPPPVVTNNIVSAPQPLGRDIIIDDAPETPTEISVESAKPVVVVPSAPEKKKENIEGQPEEKAPPATVVAAPVPVTLPVEEEKKMVEALPEPAPAGPVPVQEKINTGGPVASAPDDIVVTEEDIAASQPKPARQPELIEAPKQVPQLAVVAKSEDDKPRPPLVTIIPREKPSVPMKEEAVAASQSNIEWQEEPKAAVVAPAAAPQVKIISREKPSVPLNTAPEAAPQDDKYDHAKAPGVAPVPKDIVLGNDKSGRFYDEWKQGDTAKPAEADITAETKTVEKSAAPEKAAEPAAPLVAAPALKESDVVWAEKQPEPAESQPQPADDINISGVEESHVVPESAISKQVQMASAEQAKVEEEVPPTEVAAVKATPPQPEDGDVVPEKSDLTLGFDAGSSEISEETGKKLDKLVSQLRDTPDMRIQIRAYAAADDNGQSGARRMSLSRGLMIRAYLASRGIKPSRLDVRALGSETDQIPADRVDLVFVR